MFRSVLCPFDHLKPVFEILPHLLAVIPSIVERQRSIAKLIAAVHKKQTKNDLMKGLTNLNERFSHILQSKYTNTIRKGKKNSARKKASIGDLIIVVHSQGQTQGQVGRHDVIP